MLNHPVRWLEEDRSVGEPIAEEGMAYLRDINRKRKKIGRAHQT